MIYGKIISVDKKSTGSDDFFYRVLFDDVIIPNITGEMNLSRAQFPEGKPVVGAYLASCDEGTCAAAHRVKFENGVYHSWRGRDFLIWSDATMTGTLCAMRKCRCKCDGTLFKILKERQM